MQKLLLVHPVNLLNRGLTTNRHNRIPPLGLGIVAALTPKHWEVEILDENYEEFKFKDCDLVGITAFTSQANRAYEIAKICKEHGVTVIMGGIHATMVKEEALQYVDTIVTHEAESIWETVIKDFENKELKPEYAGTWLSMENQVPARHDLFHPDYYYGAIQTTRGCPYDCDFCSVTAFNSNKYRYRNVDDILNELETINKRLIYIVDDNLIGNSTQSRKRALALFKGIIERGIDIEIMTQADINFADDEEVLKYAAKAGIKQVFIGIEAEKEDILKDMNKKSNLKKGVENYKIAIKKINKYKIAVMGGIILGLDNDNVKDVIDRAKFLVRSPVNSMAASCLTPLPGTRVFSKMQEENRLLETNYPKDWEKYDFFHTVFKPKKMSQKELEEAYKKAIKKIFSKTSIYKKYISTRIRTKSELIARWTYYTNMHMRQAVYKD